MICVDLFRIGLVAAALVSTVTVDAQKRELVLVGRLTRATPHGLGHDLEVATGQWNQPFGFDHLVAERPSDQEVGVHHHVSDRQGDDSRMGIQKDHLVLTRQVLRLDHFHSSRLGTTAPGLVALPVGLALVRLFPLQDRCDQGLVDLGHLLVGRHVGHALDGLVARLVLCEPTEHPLVLEREPLTCVRDVAVDTQVRTGGQLQTEFLDGLAGPDLVDRVPVQRLALALRFLSACAGSARHQDQCTHGTQQHSQGPGHRFSPRVSPTFRRSDAES